MDIGLTGATSLIDQDGLSRDLTDALLAILDHFDYRWRQLLHEHFAEIASAYRERCFLTNKTVTVEQLGRQSIVGLCQGIDDSGALCLRSERGEQRVVSGTIIHWESVRPISDL